MPGIPNKLIFVFVAAMAAATHVVWAREGLAIVIPRHSQMTPVQRLNREGVEAVKKHQFEKAEALFLKAYLYDPVDAFTLNNLGYISELQGQLDHARKFYELASEQACGAAIDRSNAKQLEGKPMQFALQNLQDVPMRVNRMNVDAMNLLSQGRGFEAVHLLKQAQTLDPKNPFTGNNLGVAEESIGDFDSALKDYVQVADMHSSEPVVVTEDREWRGRPVSEMARESAWRLDKRIRKMDPAEVRAVMLALRGVSATNQNDWAAARQNFLQAYSLNPNSAFSLNNRGFVAEMDGDLETAQFFYEKARQAADANARVGLATRQFAEGKALSSVATVSNRQVDGQLESYSEERRRQSGPVELTPRGEVANPPTKDTDVSSVPNRQSKDIQT